LSCITAIFPFSTLGAKPTALKAEISGPGNNSVGPALISISCGEICPALALEGLFSLERIPEISKASLSEIA